MQRRMQTLQSEFTQLKEQNEAKNRKEKLDQQLRLKKFNKEFNAILKLTTGSNPTTLNFEKFKLFSTNMGLLTQAQSNEESDERALIYDIWKCLSRVYPDGEIISVKNLRLILIAIIGLEENSKVCATTPVQNHRATRKLETVKSEARLPSEMIGYVTYDEDEEAVYEVTSSSEEFYTDRSHRIGNFNQSLDLKLTTKDTLKL